MVLGGEQRPPVIAMLRTYTCNDFLSEFTLSLIWLPRYLIFLLP